MIDGEQTTNVGSEPATPAGGEGGSPSSSPSLREQLASAFDTLSADPAPAPSARDAGGRFASKSPAAGTDAAAGAAPKPSDGTAANGAAKPEGTAKPAAGEQPAAGAGDLKAPIWLKPEHGDWAALPPTMREAIANRERQVAQFASQAGQELKPWRDIAGKFQPFEAQMKESGLVPHQFVSNLLDTYQNIYANPVEGLQWLAGEFGVLDQLGWAGGAVEDDGEGGERREDPRIGQLQQQLRDLTTKLDGYEKAAQSAETARLTAQVKDFAKDKEHWNEVAPMVASLLKGRAASTLAEAYDMACRAHPTIGPSMLKAQLETEAERARAGQVTKKSGAGASGQSPKPKPSSVRAGIEAAWEELSQ